MEKAIVEPVLTDPNSLLLDISGLSESELEALVVRQYQDIYLDNAIKGIRKTHDGQPVLFYRNVCTGHAFHKTVNGAKEGICPLRVQRVRWIKEFIEGNVANSYCWTVPEDYVDKRIYCSFNPACSYVIWLKPRDEGGFKFETAYPASPATVGRYTHRRGAKQICKF